MKNDHSKIEIAVPLLPDRLAFNWFAASPNAVMDKFWKFWIKKNLEHRQKWIQYRGNSNEMLIYEHPAQGTSPPPYKYSAV